MPSAATTTTTTNNNNNDKTKSNRKTTTSPPRTRNNRLHTKHNTTKLDTLLDDTHRNTQPHQDHHDADRSRRYCEFAIRRGLPPNPAVVAFLRLRLPELAPRPFTSAAHHHACRFGDADCTAACDFLLAEPAIFAHWRSVNLSECSIGAPGCVMLARLLALPACRVERLDLRGQRIGVAGSAAIPDLLRSSTSIVALGLQHALISDVGTQPFIDLLASSAESERPLTLRSLDLRTNALTYQLVSQLERMVKGQHRSATALASLEIHLDGNLPFDELLSSASHALGAALSVVAYLALAELVDSRTAELQSLAGGSGAAVDHPPYAWATTVYTVSLFIQYAVSAIYHFAYAMSAPLTERAADALGALDNSAIYCLIAGSYTPFLAILFADDPAVSFWMLCGIWAAALVGIIVRVTYYGPYKQQMQITSYVAMGWTAVLIGRGLYERLHGPGLRLLFGGGLAYTGGVPFFVKNGRTLGMPDHTIWHLFVMLGSSLHYLCIKDYVIAYPYDLVGMM